MDRLICGEVGYGKTEVALRAAFKAIMDSKQVAILVPTTVLAQQHYTNFSRRLAAFPHRGRVRDHPLHLDLLKVLPDLAALEEVHQAVPAGAGVVADEGEILGAQVPERQEPVADRGLPAGQEVLQHGPSQPPA